MHYLLLVYMDEKKWLQLPAAERQRVYQECEVYGGELTKSGHFLGGAPLQLSTTAQTVRADGDGCLVTDGPFAETKEVLAGSSAGTSPRRSRSGNVFQGCASA